MLDTLSFVLHLKRLLLATISRSLRLTLTSMKPKKGETALANMPEHCGRGHGRRQLPFFCPSRVSFVSALPEEPQSGRAADSSKSGDQQSSSVLFRGFNAGSLKLSQKH